MAGHDIITIGASAGGVEALRAVVRGLPENLPAAVFVVLHMPSDGPGLLANILDRSGPLPATAAHDGEPIECGRIYVVVPDHHLLIERDKVRVLRGPKENRHRPAIDPLFRSAARFYGPRAVGVVLTGALDDGTAGLLAIKSRGGVAIVQDPEEAMFPSMPHNAMQRVQVDHVALVEDIPALLERLAGEPAGDEGEYPVSEQMDLEVQIAEAQGSTSEVVAQLGAPSAFACPECHGTLWEIRDADLLRFRCQVGHAYSAETLLSAQTDGVEAALWAALRALEEKGDLNRRLANSATLRDDQLTARQFNEQYQAAEHHSAILRKMLADAQPSNARPNTGANASAEGEA